MTRWLAAAIGAVVLLAAGWFGWQRWRAPSAPTRVQTIPVSDVGGAETVETIATETVALPTGGTPMADRVAVLGLLNKRNGVSRELTLKPGQATRIGDVVVRLSACEKTAPWEQEQLTGAFVQLDIRAAETGWRRAFSGWLFKERPALNVVQHPIYDVWTKSCTMSWPETGPDTERLGAGAPKASRSRTPNRPAETEAEGAPAPAESPSASPSSAT
jgi:hypothetical protein